ncbi:MAG: hypothetical protein S4CHLAM6_09140 [Chlamydiae bacterium]|nr:hypothetical protein [Chlamydiota bacterium]
MDLDTARIFKIIDQLLGQRGCPWSKKQNAETLCQYIIEESYEVIDAISLKDSEKVQEELGDVLFAVLFSIAVACKSFDIEPEAIVEEVSKKIVRRHPHVFDNPHPITLEELRSQWERIKAQERKEKGSLEKEDLFSCIAHSLPVVVRAMKLVELGVSRGFHYKPDESSIEGRFMKLIIDGLSQYENVERTFEAGLADYKKQFEEFLKQEESDAVS